MIRVKLQCFYSHPVYMYFNTTVFHLIGYFIIFRTLNPGINGLTYQKPFYCSRSKNFQASLPQFKSTVPPPLPTQVETGNFT